MPGPESKAIIRAEDLRGTDDSPGRGALRRVTLRLLPFLFLLYVVNILDRANVGFAKLKMLPDLGLTGDRAETIFGLGAGFFFYLGYLLFEVPSNLVLHRVGARRWIGRIMVGWGVVSAAMLFVAGQGSFYSLRFLLGVAEAGFFPGIILYLSYWFPARERARAVAVFMAASPVTAILGNPLSGLILDHLDGTAGLASWQWLFLMEGIPSVVLGIAVWFYLTDRPEQAHWLTPAERDWLVTRMEAEARHRAERHGLTRLGAMLDPRVWLLIALYFTVAVGSNVLGFFGPTIVRGLFAGASGLQIGLLTALPSAAAVVGMVVIGTHSDRSGERRLHVAGSALLAAAGWMLAATAGDPWLALAGLVVAQVGMSSMLPTFWALASSFLSGTAAAGGIALINSVANLGGALGPPGFGRLEDATGNFTSGMVVVSGVLFAGALLALCVRHDPNLEKR